MYQKSDLLFTVCFLTRADEVLMLLRKKPPNQGKWNGVGGHIERGETPYQSALREVYEETGLRLKDLHFGGILTWEGFEIQRGGLYIFSGEAPAGRVCANGEGELCWHKRKFVFEDQSVVSNIHVFLPEVLSGAAARQYHFEYREGVMTRHRSNALPAWVDIHGVY